MDFDTANYQLSPALSLAHDEDRHFLLSPELLFDASSVLIGGEYFPYDQITDTLQLASNLDGPCTDRATPEDPAGHSSSYRHIASESNMTWEYGNDPIDITLDGRCIDRNGTPQTLKELPGNLKIARPDDTIHAELRTTQDIILLLSDPYRAYDPTSSRGSCWKGQLNGRNQFKVVSPSKDCQNMAPKMRLFFYIESVVRYLDFKTDMKHMILPISGHLAIEVKKDEPIKVALLLPSDMPVTSEFRIVIGVAPETVSDGRSSMTLRKESFLTLSDCALPMSLTTKYPVRPRKLSVKARSYGTAGPV